MNYEVHDPPPELKDFIKCFWILEDEKKELQVRQRIIPDGCMEMIFHFGDLYQQYFEDGSSIIQPRSFIYGQISSFIEIAPTGTTGIIAARFLPDGLAPLLDIPVVSLENKAVGIEKIFGKEGKLLESLIINSTNNEERKKILQFFLLQRIVNPATINKITKSCLETIFLAHGKIGISELAKKTAINKRKLERTFITAVGMSPKQLSKIIRLQNTISMLNKKQYNSLTELAYENGYYDQAHFIKDFREFTGISPKSFFEENLQLAKLFIANN